MRMHRGSSKEVAGRTRPSEGLPLSASRGATITVTVEVARAADAGVTTLTLREGASVRDAIHAVGLAVEATSPLIHGRSVPADRPLQDGERVELLRTFSGG